VIDINKSNNWVSFKNRNRWKSKKW